MSGGLTGDTAAWLEAETRCRLVEVELLPGGISSTVARCVFDDGTRLVVRQIDDRAWLEREPHLIEQEATALTIMERRLLVTPSLVAIGDGALAMTEVPGRMMVDVESLHRRVEAMAETTALIAATDPPPGLMPWRSWVPQPLEPPPWGNQALWSIAIERYAHGPALDPAVASPALLHRDFHPLNLLWTGNHRLPAVVDWVNACVGHPHAELGHCRWNLAVLDGIGSADRFLDRYLALADASLSATLSAPLSAPSSASPSAPLSASPSAPSPGIGRYDSWWDLDAVLDKMPGPIDVSAWHAVGRTDLTQDRVIERTERFLASVLARRDRR